MFRAISSQFNLNEAIALLPIMRPARGVPMSNSLNAASWDSMQKTFEAS
jgi:hypothetical protein